MPADWKQSTSLAGKILASSQVQPQYVLTTGGSPTGGTFTLQVQTPVSTQQVAITYLTNLTAAAVQTAIAGLSNVGVGNVTVNGPNGGAFIVTFTVPTVNLTVASFALTGGSTPSMVLTSTPVSTTVYTVPANTSIKVSTLSLSNPGSVTSIASLAVIPNAGSADGTHLVVTQFNLAVSDSTVVSECVGDLWDAGASVVVTALNGPVNIKLTGAVSS